MTDEELRELISSLAVSQLQTNLQIQQTDQLLRESSAETDRQLRESGAETDRQLRELSAELRESDAETDRQLRELSAELRELSADLRESSAETERVLRESDAKTDQQLRALQQETDRLAKQMGKLGKQMGELGNKFGSFTEGMAFPSMRKLLMERFGADFVTLRPKKKKGGETLEVDVLAVSNSQRNAAYVVEVKSHLTQEGVRQMLRILRDFPKFYPEQRDKQLYGVLALVDASDAVRRYALKRGLYLAEISGDVFKLCVPGNFVARSYQKPSGTPPPSPAPASQPSV